jgi:hypothetical protein
MDELEERNFRNSIITDSEYWHFQMMENDYNIEFVYDYKNSEANSVSVNIKSKNSYISTLLSKDSYGDQKGKTLQSV